MKNIAIIIDCWGDPNRIDCWGDPLHYNIINLISTNQTIDSVILATYQLPSDEFDTNNLWYINFKNFNYSKLFTNPIVERDISGDIRHPNLGTSIRRKYGHADISYQSEERTCNCLLDKVWSDKFQIAAFHPYQFFHPYQLKLNSIKNVYFFGGAWDICVRTRPMGYTWWIEKTNTNLFVYQDGIDVGDKSNAGINTNQWEYKEHGLYQFNRKFAANFKFREI
tara:strand:- start:115 stop:783 length:669 start_codon:yes stop_codon:yes gene_type:complete